MACDHINAAERPTLPESVLPRIVFLIAFLSATRSESDTQAVSPLTPNIIPVCGL